MQPEDSSETWMPACCRKPPSTLTSPNSFSMSKSYMKNIPEFYNNQIQSAGSILLSRTQKLTQEKLSLCRPTDPRGWSG